jgi:hypothetical protein
MSNFVVESFFNKTEYLILIPTLRETSIMTFENFKFLMFLHRQAYLKSMFGALSVK